jgi:hypothetical protein
VTYRIIQRYQGTHHDPSIAPQGQWGGEVINIFVC